MGAGLSIRPQPMKIDDLPRPCADCRARFAADRGVCPRAFGAKRRGAQLGLRQFHLRNGASRLRDFPPHSSERNPSFARLHDLRRTTAHLFPRCPHRPRGSCGAKASCKRRDAGRRRLLRLRRQRHRIQHVNVASGAAKKTGQNALREQQRMLPAFDEDRLQRREHIARDCRYRSSQAHSVRRSPLPGPIGSPAARSERAKPITLSAIAPDDETFDMVS